MGAMIKQQLDLIHFGVNILKPKPALSGSQWADEFFYLSPESAANPGKWMTYPWQTKIIDSMTSYKITLHKKKQDTGEIFPSIDCLETFEMVPSYVIVKKPTRVGYSLMISIVAAYFIHQRPSNQLHYQPNADEAKGFAEDTIEPMIRDNICISELVSSPSIRGRVKKEKTIKKMYPGGQAEFLGAESERNMNRRTSRVVTVDEPDAIKKELGNTGDVFSTMFRRSSDFYDRKNIMGGKPVGAKYDPSVDSEMTHGISSVDYWYHHGTQCQRYLPCPECGWYQKIEFEDFIWHNDKDSNGKTIKHYPETVNAECKRCGFEIKDKHKRKMDKDGIWVAENPDAASENIASFWPWAFLSYSPNVTWPDIVKEFLEAKNSKLKMKAFYNEVLARTFEEDYEKTDTSKMMERREHYTAQVPAGALVLTCGADVQKNRIEIEVIGWGANYESWAIEYKIFNGDPTQPEIWEQVREFILAKRWTHESGQQMGIYAGCVDAGYLTDTVASFCKPLYAKRIFATQGATTITAKIAPRVAGKTKENKPIFTVGVNRAKDEISWHIASDGGAGYMHFPVDDAYNEEYFKQLGAEVKGKSGRWEKKRARNEVMDVRTYNFIALHLAGVDLELLSHRGPLFEIKRVTAKPNKQQKQPKSHLDEY